MRTPDQHGKRPANLRPIAAVLIIVGMAIVAATLAFAEERRKPALGQAPKVHAPVASKPLPPRDCWRCMGPATCPPCLPPHLPGFLYYGTYPWDDDPVNGFNDCPGGDCGQVGMSRALRWIHARQRAASLWPGRDRHPADIGSYQYER